MPQHLPVLVAEAIRYLAPERGGCFVDCTLGLGGHTAALLERFPQARVIGLDRDRQALQTARRRLQGFGRRARIFRGRFDQLEQQLVDLGVEKVSGVLADLGVSSLQLDEAGRGFSFAREGPLDMRMGEGRTTAQEILNHYSEDELTNVLREYGEERQARRIARAIVRERGDRPLETTADLRQLIERLPTRRPRRRGRAAGDGRRIHPATRTFQALRIEVNRELDQLRELLEQAVRMLEREGRLVVISYHSLEDRIVKHRFRELATGEVEPITGRPRTETQIIEVLTKRPVRPSAEEVAANPRARSAKLRAARRL